MPDFTTTGLWIRTLAERENDPDKGPRELLRATLLGIRERAKFLAGEIARDLPEFTNHDITHLDALWETADMICGPEYSITPADAFALGGAFLIHDLGMGLAAYPDGLSSLKKEPIWTDLVTARLREKLGRNPTSDELTHPDAHIEATVKAETLRTLHASRAERLGLTSWQDSKTGETYHLIDNPDLRGIYGKLIGRIAHSHWWQVSRLKQEFPELMGAPYFANSSWTVDPLKIAAILRTADISHLDQRRAPGFARAVRKPPEPSSSHWVFQEHLQKPQLRDDRLIFTATRPFPIEESAAWWVCFETLQNVEHELQGTDALLADEGKQRFAAKGVSGIEDPRRLTEWIPTDGWLPVNALVRVTNVAGLVRTLGGEALYGPDQTVPLRELIQNASDAVRARRVLDDQPNWGTILVKMGKDTSGSWIEVEDNGVGMSEEVLCGALLDFGNAYWGSAKMTEDFPGLLSKGFGATGQFGIGFFSLFMWGDRVRVATRRYENARRDTKILEFTGGPESRAILRPAEPSEFLRDGGTRIRVWLARDPDENGGLLNSVHRRSEYSLEDLCIWLAPAIDVDLFVAREGSVEVKVIEASDWLSITPQELLRRVLIFNSDLETKPSQEMIDLLSGNVRPLRDASGETIGRACIIPYRLIPGWHGFDEPGGFAGTVAVGGLRSTHMCRIAGLLKGVPVTAARNVAAPVVAQQELALWATEQAKLASNLTQAPEHLIEFADVVAQCGGDTCNLPIGYFLSQPVSKQQVSTQKELPEELILMMDDTYESLSRSVPDLKLDSGVFALGLGNAGILHSSEQGWPIQYHNPEFFERTIARIALEAIGRAWGLPDGWVSDTYLESVRQTWENRKVGSANGSPISGYGAVLRKPNATELRLDGAPRPKSSLI